MYYLKYRTTTQKILDDGMGYTLYILHVYHVSRRRRRRRHVYPPKCIHSYCMGIAIENEYNIMFIPLMSESLFVVIYVCFFFLLLFFIFFFIFRNPIRYRFNAL